MPPDQRDASLGDAAEEFARRVRERGPRSARSWYRRQVFRSLRPGLENKMWRAGMAVRAAREGDGMIATWRKDLALAFRVLAKRPGFSTVVVLTLALGVGANTALFGVFKTVFLEPVPLPESDELVIVMQTGSFGCCGPSSGPDYLDWVERNRSFEGIATLRPGFLNLTGLDEPERVYGTRVTASAFEFLDTEPLMGRYLLPDDELSPGTVLLSHGLWQRALGGRPDVVGEALNVNGNPLTIVGVMPEGFDVPSPWARTRNHELYLPFQREDIEQGNRGNHSFPVVARLAEGTSIESAQADMDRIMAELAEEYPITNAQRGAKVFFVHEYLYGDVGRQLLLILGAAGLVLLIACGNVAGLQLARAAGRETELAVRSALGASRPALVRLLFAESLMLALLGGVLGIAVSVLAIDLLTAILPPSIPRIEAVGIDAWALLFAVGATSLTVVLFGMLPATLASRTDLAQGVREGGQGGFAPRKERVRDYFIVAQIAIGLVLANGAALLVRSYTQLRGEETGFHSEGVLTLALNPAGPRYEDFDVRLAFFDEVVAQVEAVPGVVSAGVVSKLPLNGGSNGNVLVEGRGPRANADEGPLVEVSSVSGDYFESMGIPLLRGRTLVADDSAAARVGVVINSAMANEVWPGENPIGKRFSFEDDPPAWRTVVGVVGDVKQFGPERPAIAEAYFPYKYGWSGSGFVAARVTGDLPSVADQVRRAVLQVDPTQPPSNLRTMSERLESAFAQRRFYTSLIGIFAIAALLLASAGIYGTVSYFVARRVRELGIRMALGAGGTGIMALVVRRGIRVAFWGLLIGVGGVWASTRVVEKLLYGVSPIDVPTVVLGCVVLAGVTIAASGLPAARAVRISPVLALRSE